MIERRLLRWLLLFHCLFILYGSFIPFRFNFDSGYVHYRLGLFLTLPYNEQGLRQFSIPDVFSNIVLFMPFGFLWVGAVFSQGTRRRYWIAVPAMGAIGWLFGLAIESGQLFSPGRTASWLDMFCNGIGSAIGAAVGCFLFRALGGKFGSVLLHLLRERPSVILLALLVLAPAGNAYYPFDVTLDLSTIWHNFRAIQWSPFGILRRFWFDLFVEKSIVFAAIAYLVYRNLAASRYPATRFLAGIACTALAVVIEAAKLFFAGRVPNAQNTIFSATGVLCGVLFIPPLADAPLIRSRGRQILTILILSIIAYSELSPFDWIGSPVQLAGRISKIEWLPFASYYYAVPQAVLFDLAKKLFLVGSFGFLIAAGTVDPRRARGAAAIAGSLVGAMLETAQIALESRSPSITDVILFGVAAWAGAVVFERYRQASGLNDSVPPSLSENLQRVT